MGLTVAESILELRNNNNHGTVRKECYNCVLYQVVISLWLQICKNLNTWSATATANPKHNINFL